MVTFQVVNWHSAPTRADCRGLLAQGHCNRIHSCCRGLICWWRDGDRTLISQITLSYILRNLASAWRSLSQGGLLLFSVLIHICVYCSTYTKALVLLCMYIYIYVYKKGTVLPKIEIQSFPSHSQSQVKIHKSAKQHSVTSFYTYCWCLASGFNVLNICLSSLVVF